MFFKRENDNNIDNNDKNAINIENVENNNAESEPETGVEILTNNNGEPVYETLDQAETTENKESASDEFIEGNDEGGELPEMHYEANFETISEE